VLLINNRYAGMLQKVISLAKRQIYVTQFKIDHIGVRGNGIVADVLNLLAKKSKEGVKVKVLLDCILPLRGRAANNAKVAQWMIARGIEVKYLDRNRCQHSKVVIVDSEHLLLGSHNWSQNSLLRNEEMSIYLTHLEMGRRMDQIFQSNFDNACDFDKAKI